MRALLDTNVLVSDTLWLGLVAMQTLGGEAGAEDDGGRSEAVPLQLFTTRYIRRELYGAYKHVYTERSNSQLRAGLKERGLTLTDLNMTDMEVTRRGFVKDPTDAHLDIAAWQGGMDVLVSNDVRAFAPVVDAPGGGQVASRGYRLVTADAFLAELWGQAPEFYAERFVDTWRELYSGYCERTAIELDTRPASEHFRRARAFTLAKRVRGLH